MSCYLILENHLIFQGLIILSCGSGKAGENEANPLWRKSNFFLQFLAIFNSLWAFSPSSLLPPPSDLLSKLIFFFISTRETRVFQTWSEESLQALCLDSRVNQYPTNSVIVGNSKRNDEWLFMCLEVDELSMLLVQIILSRSERFVQALKFLNT